MVANLAQEAIGADENEVTLLDDSGTHKLARAPKDDRRATDHRPHREALRLRKKGQSINAKDAK